ncbi:MAG TPA: hypothetical protein PK887_10730 [Ignavibacteriales bacterium]|jgi:hypothetical protein|nr:hypothetical protein [Ignavibacteriales bacterium]
MKAYEFITNVKKNLIEIPDDIEIMEGKRVKVILLVEEELPKDDFISGFLEKPLNAKIELPQIRCEVYE